MATGCAPCCRVACAWRVRIHALAGRCLYPAARLLPTCLPLAEPEWRPTMPKLSVHEAMERKLGM